MNNYRFFIPLLIFSLFCTYVSAQEQVCFNCIADTWVMESAPTHSGSYDERIEINNGITGLFGFEFNVPSGKKVSSATLHFVTGTYKTSMDLFGYSHDFDETANWNDEETFIKEAKSKTALVSSFYLNGAWPKDIFYDIIDEANQSLEKWTNNVDVTDYVASLPSSTARVNFILTNATEKNTVFSKDNNGSDAFPNGDGTYNAHFTSDQLIPCLFVTFEDSEDGGVVSFTTSADTQVWKGIDNNFGANKEMEIYTWLAEGSETELDREFYGLLQFEILEQVRKSGNFEVENAELRLVCTQWKGDPTMQIFDYPNNFEESTVFSSEETYIRQALSQQPAAVFTAQGVNGWAMVDGAQLTDETKSADGWTSFINLTELVRDKTQKGENSLNLLLKRRDDNNFGNGNAMKFATKEAQDIEAKNGDVVETTFTADDLRPLLTITYKLKDTDEPESPDYLTFETISATEARVVKCLNSSDVKVVKVPDSVTLDGVSYAVTEIGEKAFYENYNITEVSLPDGIRSIGYMAFANTTNLKKVNIPAALVSIASWAFYLCGAENEAILPAGVSEVGEFAFSTCHFATIDMSAATNISKIEKKVFYSNKWTTTVILPPNITEIGEEAFAATYEIKHIDIPESVSVLGESAFSSSSINELYIPEGITIIPNNLCYSCKNLKTVTLPSTVTYIRDAFSNNPQLTTLVCKSTTPPQTSGYPFKGSHNDKLNLYFPHDSYDEYLNPDLYWDDNFDYFYCIEDDSESNHIEVLSEGSVIDHESVVEFKDNISFIINCHHTTKSATSNFVLKKASEEYSLYMVEEGVVTPLNAGKNVIELGDELTLNQRYLLTIATNESADDESTHNIYIVRSNGESAVSAIEAENGVVEFFNLQGVKVANPDKGSVLIKVQGGKASKVIL